MLYVVLMEELKDRRVSDFTYVTNKVDPKTHPPDFDLMALLLMSVLVLIFPIKIKQLFAELLLTKPVLSSHSMLSPWPSQSCHPFILPILPTFLLGRKWHAMSGSALRGY